MLLGHSVNNLSDKNRLIIPTIYRKDITVSDEVLFSVDSEKYFKLYTKYLLEKEIEHKKRLMYLSIINHNNEIYDKLIKEIEDLQESIVDIKEVDVQNRLTIPEKIRQLYNIKKQLYLLGSNTHIKVFTNKDEYNKYIN